jgi:hypothetical protein
MDVERFRASPIGSVTPIAVEQHGRQIGHYAFQPDPLDAASCEWRLVCAAHNVLEIHREQLAAT